MGFNTIILKGWKLKTSDFIGGLFKFQSLEIKRHKKIGSNIRVLQFSKNSKTS